MKIIAVAIPTLLVTTLLSACAIEAEDPIEDLSIEPTESSTPTPGDAESPAAAPELVSELLDGRAAAMEESRKSGTSILGLVSSWYSGTIAPGATQHWYWNNSSHTAAFQVGLSPIGASTSAACKVEVSRTWDVQRNGGEREFHFYVKNIGTVACGANVYIGSKTRFTSIATGGIAAGASKSFTWNNANPLGASHLISVDPSGATSADACEMEVTRIWYVQQSSGERELKYTIKNVGDIACQGNIQLALGDADVSSWSTGSIAAGSSKTMLWNNALPLDRIYVPGVSPLGAPFIAPCQLEVTSSYYRQVINSTGAAERELYATVKNSGSVACAGSFLLNYVD